MSTALLPVTLSMLCAGMAGIFPRPRRAGAGGLSAEQAF